MSTHVNSRSDRGSYGRDHWSVLLGDSLQPIAVDPELTKDQGDWERSRGRAWCRVLALLYSSADRCFCKWEDVVLESFACNCEDHLVALRRESDITAVELAALHHKLTFDPLRWIAGFAMEEHWRSSDAFFTRSPWG